MLRVTPIYGSTGHHPSSKSISLPPSSTLIEYGDIKLLINVGHDESSSASYLSTHHQLELPQVDAVLITDSSLQALGGLPIHYGQDSTFKRRSLSNVSTSAAKKNNKTLKKRTHPSNNDTASTTAASGSGSDNNHENHNDNKSNKKMTQIYMTFPTVKMGQMTLYDHHANICLDGGDPGFTLNDIDSLFTTSKYYNDNSSTSSNTSNTHHNQGGGDTLTVNDDHNHNSTTTNMGNDSSSSSKPTASIQTLKYSQTIIINNPITNKPAISITPHKAGHLIGASYYILKRLVDETEVVVAPIYHHMKEKHLDSSTLYKYGSACDVLITCCGGPGGLLRELYSPLNTKNNNSTIIKRKLNPPSVGRDEGDLVETILSTLRRGGNVLLPVDASGRVLELVLLLNQHWEKHRLSSAYNLCWVGNMVHNTLDFVKSQLEWMAKPLGQQFDTGRGHPFTLKNVQMFSNVNDLETHFPSLFGMNVDDDVGGVGSGSGRNDGENNNVNSNPTCILASGATLDYGPARDLFLRFAENGDNTIILTDSRRCVMRGAIVAERKKKNKDKIINVDGTTLGTVGTIRISDGTNVAMISDNESIGGSSMSIGGVGGSGLSSTSDIPTIVQEDEEVAETTVNVGSSISYAELSEFCTAGQLLIKWCEAKAADVEMDDVVECDVLVPKRAALRGRELQLFLEREEELRQRERAEEERLAMLKEVELVKGRLRLSEKEESSSGQKGDSNESSSNSKVSFTENTNASTVKRPKKKSRFDANLFLKFSKPCHMTFEVREEAVGIGQSDSVAKYGIGESIGQAGDVIEDDYGIAVKHEKFIDIVSGVDPSKYKKPGGSGRIGDDVLKRGLGFGTDGRPMLASSGDNMSGGDQGQLGLDNLEDEEIALEAADLSEGNGIIRGRNNRPPVKVSTDPRRLEVLAEIAFISLEGRVDAKSARQSVRALQPRQVVILGGGDPMNENRLHDLRDGQSVIEGEAKLLADALHSLSLGERGLIFAPTNKETVELNVGHAAYSVRLIDTPYMAREEKAKFEEEGLELPSVELHEAKVGECTVSLMDCIATGQRVAADGSIVLAPRRIPKSQQSTVMLSDGDVLLTDLRSEVIAQGMKAEYSAHLGYAQLIVNGKIVVRKDQMTGAINVEGPLCEDFFLVRSTVCGQYVAL